MGKSTDEPGSICRRLRFELSDGRLCFSVSTVMRRCQSDCRPMGVPLPGGIFDPLDVRRFPRQQVHLASQAFAKFTQR
jgi:hypothetical protein